MAEIIQNITDVKVATNEVITKASLNRNLAKLYENDVALSCYQQLSSAFINIRPWQNGQVYDMDELVWYKDITEDGDIDLYLLRSLYEDNMNKPVLDVQDGIPNFEDSGWADMNKFGTVYNSFLSSYIRSKMTNYLALGHESVADIHYFGELSCREQVDEKVLKNDFSNLDHSRKKNLFPYETGNLSSDNVIIDGTWRKWDCGLMEYDIIFKLGVVDSKNIIYRNSYEKFDIISANTFLPVDGSEMRTLDENDPTVILSVDREHYNFNNNYFLTSADYDIFTVVDDPTVISANNMVQGNLGHIQNVFSADIIFPQEFVDFNYMVFSSDSRSVNVSKDAGVMTDNLNSMLFTNRHYGKMTALYIVTSQTELVEGRGGLLENNFHCQVIGRWK